MTKIVSLILHCLDQRFSTSVLWPQEFLKHAIPNYSVRGPDIVSLRLSNKKITTANTTRAIWCAWIKIIPVFCQISKIHIFGMPQHFSNSFTCAMGGERLKITGLDSTWLTADSQCVCSNRVRMSLNYRGLKYLSTMNISFWSIHYSF